MTVSTHLTFNGDCEAAFRFYEQALGGKDLALFRYGDSPQMGGMMGELEAGGPGWPEWSAKIVHASLRLGDGTIAGADVPPPGWQGQPGAGAYEAPRGFFVLLGVATRAEAKRVFAALADQGNVRMPLQRTFWSPAFGVLVDRFGVPWEVSAAGPA
jgi:PhnB protein